MYHGLRSCSYLRLLEDTIQEQSMFVYKYFTNHLLSLVQKNLPIALTKRVSKINCEALQCYTIKILFIPID